MATETNAERLEMLTNMVESIDGDFTAQVFGYKLDGQKIVEDMKWLIEQAGRAQEWETSNARISKIALNRQKYIDELVDENARLREALVELSQGKFDCYEDECANFALNALAGEPNGQR